MNMGWQHWLFLAVIFVAGFWVAKKFPSLFASIPGATTVGLT